MAESFKFVRVFPLTQADVQSEPKAASEATGTLRVVESVMDYTPPGLISLLFTDIGLINFSINDHISCVTGVLTPSAVSDELIKLYL